MSDDRWSEALLDAAPLLEPPYRAPQEAGAGVRENGLPVTSTRPRALAIKRGVDVVLGALALVISLPLLLVAACLIALEDRGPVIYRQRRMGLGMREFEILKLRSMRVNDLSPETVGQVFEDHPMVTRVGRLIRRYKIDELPQLVNVIRGDMSLVGPRPPYCSLAYGYGEFERRRLYMRPGLSGWAQVAGSIGTSWDERILLDVWYVDHWGLWLDARIIARTLGVVLFGERSDTQAVREARRHALALGRSR